MIVGNGLIASAIGDIEGVIVFASGVANSTERRQEEFDREVALFDTMPDNRFLVYFSTCAVFEWPYTPYVEHKRNMERLVMKRRGLVIRLPQVAGRSANSHTLLNFLHQKIVSGEPFEIWSRAVRRVIDIDDIVPVARQHIKSMCPVIINYTTTPVTVMDIVTALEKPTHKRGQYQVVNKGSACSVPGVHIDSDLNTIAGKYYGDS